MRNRMSAGRVTATRPMSALISAALLLLTVVAGVGGVGGFAGLGRTSAAPVTTAAASTIGIPTAKERRAKERRAGERRAGERRSAPGLGTSAGQAHAAGWAPHPPEPADLPVIADRLPSGLAAPAVVAGPIVIALTVQVSHRGRAPPAGSLLT